MFYHKNCTYKRLRDKWKKLNKLQPPPSPPLSAIEVITTLILNFNLFWNFIFFMFFRKLINLSVSLFRVLHSKKKILFFCKKRHGKYSRAFIAICCFGTEQHLVRQSTVCHKQAQKYILRKGEFRKCFFCENKEANKRILRF